MAEPAKKAETPKNLSPQAARALAAREARLEAIDEQVKDGSLVVRQMTAAERKRFQAQAAKRPPKPKQRPRSR
jgi:hypothetical protein